MLQSKAIAPESGCDLNEGNLPYPSPWPLSHPCPSNPTLSRLTQKGDPYQTDWQDLFYGSNYPRLLSIKAKYDPIGIFYATTAVGNEGWKADIDGKLGRVSSQVADS